MFFFIQKKKERKSIVAFNVSYGIGARSHDTKIDTQKQKTLREEGKKNRTEEFFSFT
jgi:hypothetical protein